MRNRFLVTLLLFLTPAMAFAKPKVVVSINPIYQIVKAIAGNKADVYLVMKSQVSEHHSQLKRKDLAAISQADLLFYVDAELERNLAKLLRDKQNAYALTAINGLKILQQRAGKRRKDYHIWLNPNNAMLIAQFVTDQLIAVDAKHSKVYRDNLKVFKQKIARMEGNITALIRATNTKNQVLFTQDYYYFEEYFGFRPLQVMLSGHGKDLRISDMRSFNALLSQQKVRCVVGDKYDRKNTVQKLASNNHLQYLNLDLIGFGKGYFRIINDIARTVSSCQS